MKNPNKFFTKKPEKDFIDYLKRSNSNKSSKDCKLDNKRNNSQCNIHSTNETKVSCSKNNSGCNNCSKIPSNKIKAKENATSIAIPKHNNTVITNNKTNINSKTNLSSKTNVNKEDFLKKLINEIKIHTLSEKSDKEIMKELDSNDFFNNISLIEDCNLSNSK